LQIGDALWTVDASATCGRREIRLKRDDVWLGETTSLDSVSSRAKRSIQRRRIVGGQCKRERYCTNGPTAADASRSERNIQSHTIAPEWNARVVAAGFTPPLDGITEVWTGGAQDPASDDATAKAAMALVEDERRFVEMGASRVS
jgi:hypothetical protein